jgi:hypothetical protein
MRQHQNRSPDASEAEVFYFRLLHSYLLQQPDLHLNYEILLDVYNRAPEAFSIFTRNDLLRIKQIQDDIKTGRHTLFSGPLSLSTDIPDALRKEKSDHTHRQICREIAQHPSVLEPHTGPIHFLNLEHPTQFGLIDILAQSEECAYIIEVKTKAADHSIIGQVQKYFVGMSLKLMYKTFDEIKILTVCPGYDQPSYQGLRHIGAKSLILRDNPLSINTLGWE